MTVLCSSVGYIILLSLGAKQINDQLWDLLYCWQVLESASRSLVKTSSTLESTTMCAFMSVNCLLWATTHPSQHEENQSISYIDSSVKFNHGLNHTTQQKLPFYSDIFFMSYWCNSNNIFFSVIITEFLCVEITYTIVILTFKKSWSVHGVQGVTWPLPHHQ